MDSNTHFNTLADLDRRMRSGERVSLSEMAGAKRAFETAKRDEDRSAKRKAKKAKRKAS